MASIIWGRSRPTLLTTSGSGRLCGKGAGRRGRPPSLSLRPPAVAAGAKASLSGFRTRVAGGVPYGPLGCWDPSLEFSSLDGVLIVGFLFELGRSSVGQFCQQGPARPRSPGVFPGHYSPCLRLAAGEYFDFLKGILTIQAVLAVRSSSTSRWHRAACRSLRGVLPGNRNGVFRRCWLANALGLRGHPRHAYGCWFESFR